MQRDWVKAELCRALTKVLSRAVQKAKKGIAVLGIAAVGGAIVDSQGPPAHAAFALKDALITVGVGTAVGTVVGASTLSFYSDAGDHIENVLLGAGAGTIAGLGLALYLLAVPGDSGNSSQIGGAFEGNLARLDSRTRTVFQDFRDNPLLSSFQKFGRKPPSLALNFFKVSF